MGKHSTEAMTPMANTHIQFTQIILDRNQPGKDAKAVLAEWGVDLLRNERPDVLMLPAMLYDAFGQEDLSRPREKVMIELNNPTFLMTEVVYRYLRDVLGQDFIDQSDKLFEQAQKFRLLHDSVSRNMGSIERDRTYHALHRDGQKVVQDTDALARQVYLMGDAKRILLSLGSRKIRPLYAKDEVLLGIDGEPMKRSSLRIPAFERIKVRVDAAHEAVDQMSNRELSIRLLRSLSATDIAKRDVERPAYGSKTVFAYAPIIIDRLMNNWSFDNKPVIDELSESMTLATEQLKAIKRRLDRVQSGPELA